MHIINAFADAGSSFSRLYMVIYTQCIFLPVFAQQLHIRISKILMIFLCFVCFSQCFRMGNDWSAAWRGKAV